MSALNVIITIACLVAFCIEVIGFITYYILKKRPDRISFIRSFKKGKCAIIYIVAIPLFWIGIMYTKAQKGLEFSMVNEVFTAIHKVINLVVLKFEVEPIERLMNDFTLYAVAVYTCFALVIINAGLFTMSFVGQYLWVITGKAKRRMLKKDQLLIFGYNESNLDIYKSDTKRAKVIVAPLTKEDEDSLYQQDIKYMDQGSYERAARIFMKYARDEKREHIAIINTGSDEKNIAICRILTNEINTFEKDKDQLFLRTRIFVFGDPKYQTIYDDIVADGFGCIHYVNKYQKIAMDFIDKYPLAYFMDENQLDYKTSLVKKDANINVVLIGFGKTAQQLFLTSVANNQFLRYPLKNENGKMLEDKNGEPELKRVCYHIFDKSEAKNNKNLNHSYYRYKNECLLDNLASDSDEFEHRLGEGASAYLPLPKVPAREYFYKLDVNDNSFYKTIYKIITQGKNDKSFVVVAFGGDLENIDMAQKLIEKRKEWGLQGLEIFVKARAFHKQDTLIEDENCYFFGYEKEIVYDIEKILGDDIYKMAKMRNEIYDIEYYITHENQSPTNEEISRVKSGANVRWHKGLSPMLRESSLYACLSIRAKLNLMGLDYVKNGEYPEKKGLTYEEYIGVYSHDGDIPVVRGDIKAQGKDVVKYDINFNPHSMRTYFGIHEHQRWNSFMISKGLIPSTLDQIYNERLPNGKYSNGKRYDARRHGNITTFDGLIGFRRLLAYRDSGNEFTSYESIINTPQAGEENHDVIKYDYQLLDDAYWLLTENNFKIIRKA
ncbi:MAG: hypothetical protein II980_01365 [Clostridia bacterium]|nr:hypothetical protein [Clostridia bacterium]